ncbi:MAG: MlaD family protein [Acidobacteriota bacterium]
MNQALRVGIFMTVCLLVIGYMILRIEDISLFGRKGPAIDIVFDSVAGLDDKAAVRIAGVRVGRVDGIGLKGSQARVTARLDQPIRLTQGTTASVASLSLLGEKYVELVPGPDNAPLLAAGTVLKGTTPVTFDQAMAKINNIADSLGEVTGSLTGKGGSENAIGRLIANLEATSADIRALVGANRAQVNATIGNFEKFSATLAEQLPKLTQQMQSVLAQVDGVVGENRENLKGSMANIREVTDRIQTSVDNLNEISTKIAKGEGTIGKLVQSDAVHDQLMTTLGSIDSGVKSLGDTLGRVQKLKLDLGFEGGYLQSAKDSRSQFNLNLRPNENSNHEYRVEVVSDPRGREQSKTEVVTVLHPDGSQDTTTTRKVTTDQAYSISAQYGYKIGAAELRAGLIESSGGGGIDYSLFDQRLKLSFDAFQFNRAGDLNAHLRLAGRWYFNPSIYVMGGYDDFLEKKRDSVVFGAGIRWNDDDLKYLLGSLPKF